MPKPLLIEWRTDYLRPVAVASVYCPKARDIMKKKTVQAWLTITCCEGCRYAHTIHMNIKQRTGEVQCGA